jgi:outer membrane receptor protein involved in Fe transport
MKKFAILFSFGLLINSQTINSQNNSVEEIIVTATKTEKTLQEVPVAVSVVTADTIEKANIVDILDLKAVVPSLDTRQRSTSTQSTFFIRGFGNGDYNQGIEPSVAVFIDGVYRSKMQSQISDLPLIERIEVLRGPQSTLFGKNATAGVINVVTKKPSFEKSSFITTTVGNFNSQIGKIYTTGPINETSAYSLYASFNKSDGSSENITTGNDSNNRDRYSLRGEIFVQPSDDLSVRITADYDEYDETCCAVGSAAYGAANQIAAAMGGAVIPNNPFTQKVFFDFDPDTSGDNSGISAHIKYNFNDMVLESISSIRNSYMDNVQDVDFDGAPIVNPSPITQDLDQITQEFRLYSDNDSDLNWLIGAHYYKEEMDYGESIYYGAGFRPYIGSFLDPTAPEAAFVATESAFGLPIGTIFATGAGTTETATQENISTSIFMQADYNITEKLNILVGVSYLEDEKTVSYNQVNTDFFSQLDFVGIVTAQLMGLGFPAATAQAIASDPAQNELLAFQALQLLPQFVNFPNVANTGKSKDDNVDHNIKLTYSVNDFISIYGGVSTGFKASAWNISRDSRPTASEVAALAAAGTPVGPNTTVGTRYADPEKAEVLELGAKIGLPTGYLNIAIFDQEIEDFQTNTFVGTGFVLANAGSQSSDGYEFDLVMSPTESIDLAVSGLFMDPIYDSYVGAAAGDLTGTVPSNIPEDTISSTVTYNFNMNNWDSYLRISHLYSSKAFLLENPTHQAILESRGNGFRKQDTLNFTLGFEKDDLSISLWGKNINDDEYLTSAFVAVADLSETTFFGYPNAYKTYGVTLNYSF